MNTLDSYIIQGYEIPAGYTAETIATEQDTWGIDEMYVPVTGSITGTVAWGVPFVDGEALTLSGVRLA